MWTFRGRPGLQAAWRAANLKRQSIEYAVHEFKPWRIRSGPDCGTAYKQKSRLQSGVGTLPLGTRHNRTGLPHKKYLVLTNSLEPSSDPLYIKHMAPSPIPRLAHHPRHRCLSPQHADFGVLRHASLGSTLVTHR